MGQQSSRGWNPNIPLMVTGLGMMASDRRDFLGALGEGGLLGTKTHIELTKDRKDREEKRLDREAEIMRTRLIASARSSAGGITGSEARAQRNALRSILGERAELYADTGLSLQVVDQFMNAFMASGDINIAAQVLPEGMDKNRITDLITNNFKDDWLTLYQYERLVTSGMGGVSPEVDVQLDYDGFESLGAV